MDSNQLQEDKQAVTSFITLKQFSIQFEGNRLNNQYGATLHEMPDETYLAYDASGYKIRRINKQGKVLTQHNIQQPSGTISSKIEVIDDDTLIFILNTRQQSVGFNLVQWNLQTNEKILVKFSKSLSQVGTTLYRFPQTKKLCIATGGLQNYSIFCFSYPLTSNKDEPFKVIKQVPSFPRQLDNHSKLVSLNKYYYTQNQAILLLTYDILSSQDKPIQLLFREKILQNQQIFSSYLIDIWQPNSKSIFLQFQQKFDTKKYHLKHKNLTPQLKTKANQLAKQTKYNYFIWQFQKQGNEGIRKLQIPQNAKQKQCMVQFVGSMRNKNLAKMYQQIVLMQPNKMYKPFPSYYVALPIILLESQNFQLIEVFFPKISPAQLQQSRQNCLYNKEKNEMKFAVYRFKYDVIKVSSIVVREFLYSAEIVCTHYMQSLVEDCDEDLLYLAAQMVRGDQKVEKKQPIQEQL